MAKKKAPTRRKDFWAELEAQDVRYLSAIPRSVPEGRALVHNHISAKDEGKDRKPGESNFRAWTEKPSRKLLIRCDCGWSRLPHFRPRAHDSGTA
jgi:hypothetical protein